MARRPRLGKKLFRTLLPLLLLVFLAVGGVFGWIVYDISRPQRRAYLVNPQSFAQISGPGVKATEETWRNSDGTTARGWLLRGAQGAPGVVLLHRYGTDRSWLFNLGVKLNETTNFSILWPDLRGHGLNPPVKWSALGVSEGDDVLSALNYLKQVKSNGQPLVGDTFGVYGVELGAYAVLKAAPQDLRIKVLVLDSVPANVDEIVNAALRQETGFENRVVQFLGRIATRVYFAGKYDNTSSCAIASSLKTQKVLLLSGADAGSYLRNSTGTLAKCFPNPANVETKTDLPLTGFNLPSAPGEQGEGYDRRVIEFFDLNLRTQPAAP